jgi:imipenem/basic amino acid-specific outer membrane pore
MKPPYYTRIKLQGVYMKKTLLLSVVASSVLFAGGDIAPVEPAVETGTDYGTFSGQLRGFYIDRTYDGIVENNRNSLAVGGWVGYETPEVAGLSLVAKYYGVNGFKIHDEDADELGSSAYDPSLYGDDFENYGFLGELYLNGKWGNTALKVGRQKLNTPLAGADDARMLPNLFEAAVLTNSDIEDTTLVLAHVTKESVGTFGNVYGPGALSLQSGYGLGFKLGTSGEFAKMGEIALGEGTDTDGVTAVAAIYSAIEGVKLQAWNYYAHDILNALYVQADSAWNCNLNADLKMKGSLQWINQQDVGDALAGEVDSNYYGAKLGTSYGNLSGYVAYSTTDSSTEGNHGVITPWGGMPAFTQGMVTRHMFFNDTDTLKVAATYNLKAYNLKATAYHTEFDVGEENSYKAGQAWTAKESGFDLIYQASSDLQLRLRGNFPTDFAPGLDWSEYRFIVNYNF